MLRILLLRTAGTNCDRELAHAFKLAGGENIQVDALHINTLLANPNGSTEAIAGICDITGRVLGLMPHPERIVDPLNHPIFTRKKGGSVGGGDGLPLFQTALTYLQTHQTITL